mmetsp:Transcript_24390/g.46283  ORF Transcript_24390/g.46283 Transcript_24390/m.46283 type:complete len:215 (+) Transcript_24390:998-1642(+)
MKAARGRCCPGSGGGRRITWEGPMRRACGGLGTGTVCSATMPGVQPRSPLSPTSRPVHGARRVIGGWWVGPSRRPVRPSAARTQTRSTATSSYLRVRAEHNRGRWERRRVLCRGDPWTAPGTPFLRPHRAKVTWVLGDSTTQGCRWRCKLAPAACQSTGPDWNTKRTPSSRTPQAVWRSATRGDSPRTNGKTRSILRCTRCPPAHRRCQIQRRT